MEKFSYSQNLIQETIKVFKEEDGVDISVDTAIEYLNQLSGLFLAFAGYKETPHGTSSAGGVSVDLITPHSCNN